MSAGHWSRQRSKGAGPRGGGGGHDKGPLRKVIGRRMRYWVYAEQAGCGTGCILSETHDRETAERARDEGKADPKWAVVYLRETGIDEILECGHAQLPVSDLIGETNAVRRRCRKCKAGKPADVADELRASLERMEG